MTEAEWLASEDPAAMLGWLKRAGSRKLRLFACACVRQVWNWVTDHRSRNAVEVAESFADEEATVAELDYAAYHATLAYQHGVPHYEPDMVTNPNERAVNAFAAAVSAAWYNIKGEVSLASRHSMAAGASSSGQADLLRDVAGNPFRPVTLPKGPARLCPRCEGDGWVPTPEGLYASRAACKVCNGKGTLNLFDPCPWITPTVLSLATAAYENRTPHGHLEPARLAVLADALEEAGVPVEEVITETVTAHYCCVRCGKQGRRRGGGYAFEGEYRCGACDWSWEPGETCTVTRHVPSILLSHLRSPGPHVRGCWAIDLVLGKY